MLTQTACFIMQLTAMISMKMHQPMAHCVAELFGTVAVNSSLLLAVAKQQVSTCGLQAIEGSEHQSLVWVDTAHPLLTAAA